MFTLPFTDFLTPFKRPQSYLEDGIDRLSSWIASSLMLIFCTIATVGLGFGNHFECMLPGNYNEDWQKFMFAYCYVQPQFFAANYDDDGDGGILLPQIYYFPWLPYFFFGHAIGFYLPKIFWKLVAGVVCRLDLESIVKEAKLINDAKNDDDKKKRIAELATYMTTTLKFSSNGDASPYFLLSSTALLFLFKKFLYVFIACAQFYAICFYIGQGNLYWGFEVLSHSIKKVNYLPSKLFPLFTKCRVPLAEDGIYVKKTVSCILGMNVIYEKFYVFTYFMLLGIVAASFLSAMYYTILFITPLRTKFIDNLLTFKDTVPIEHVVIFTHDYLGADGFLSILLIKQNFGDEVAQSILQELWNHTTSFSLSFKKKSSSPKRKKAPVPTTSVPNRYAPIPMLSNYDEY
uniref:Innexin n=1 Tax=Panagrolaimus davidi TaxID=227884 RepID=A0A914PBZ6_9BILA